MHELGVVFEVVKTVKRIKIENNLTKVDTIVLQVGQLSSMIPKYLEECFPAAIDGTEFEDMKLEIEILPANALCKSCNTVYNAVDNRGICPKCHSDEKEIISGREFFIKEIKAY